MKNFLIVSVIAMLSAGIYGAIDMSTDIVHGKMINYEKDDSKAPVAVADHSRQVTNNTASTTVSSSEKVMAKTNLTTSETPAVLPLAKKAKESVRPTLSNLNVRSFGRGDISRFSLDTNFKYTYVPDSSIVLTTTDSTKKENTVEK